MHKIFATGHFTAFNQSHFILSSYKPLELGLYNGEILKKYFSSAPSVCNTHFNQVFDDWSWSDLFVSFCGGKLI